MSISIHAPTRGATRSSFPISLISCISIHAPTRGATVTTIFVMTDAQFQSTLPREERQASSASVSPGSNISIHAPTRGATIFFVGVYPKVYISIHAPTRGATAILHKKFVYFYTIPTINI